MMSRQPPLPRGPPPRDPPPGAYSRGDSYRGDSYRGDSYRPSQPGNQFVPINGPREHMFQLRGASNRDSYAPRNPYDLYGQVSDPYRHPDYAAPPMNRPQSYRPESYRPESYRPRESEFSFRYDAPPGVDPRKYDTYRPRSPPRRPRSAQEHTYEPEKPRRVEHNRDGRSGLNRRGPYGASNRAFLKPNRAPTPELMPGMNGYEGPATKYIHVEDASDTEEAEKNVSDVENEAEQPAKKHARTERKAADGESVPKWSNPDPYTALPPPDDSQRKKKDVVKLIRKARVTNSSESSAKPDATTDDFISFDLGGEATLIEKVEYVPTLDIADVPSGPRNGSVQKDQAKAPIIGVFPPPSSSRNDSVQKPQLIGFQGLDHSSDPALGSRKRTIRDEIVGPPKSHDGGNYRQMVSGVILSKWEVCPDVPKTPWLVRDHSATPNMGFWLHKEIMDWYNFVKPRDFEELIRSKLVEDLNHRVRSVWPNAAVHSFGSFPAKLYLPTADMDIVFVSDNYMNGYLPAYSNYNNQQFYNAFKKFLGKENLALPDSVDIVAKAKVPLVKYVDRTTGLRVDVSFENNTGLIANKTFQTWKTQFPAMPILVTLIKHLLAMRGLNEPINGGIGGFSVICLVVSLLQNMPQVQSRTMIPEHHLGEVLMEFLDLYGNEFNADVAGIQLNPPRYFAKAHYRQIEYRQNGPMKLCIIDPNNPANDLTGGAKNTMRILQVFSDSFGYLRRRMGELLAMTERKNQSMLGCIMAGNYTSYKLQREHLAHVHEKLFGPVSEDF